MITTGNVQT